MLRSRYGGEALSPQASCSEAAQRFSQVRNDFRRMMEEGGRAAERRAINASADGSSSSPPRPPLPPPARPPPPAPASPAGDNSSVPAAALISPAAQRSLMRARLAELHIGEGNGSAAPAAATRSPAAAAATACSPAAAACSPAAAASSQEARARVDSGDDSPRSEGSSPRTPGAGWALSRSRLASAASTTCQILRPNSMSDLISEVKRADADKRARRLLEEREMIAARQALNRKLRAISTLQTAMRKRRWRKMISSNSTHGPTCAPAARMTPPARSRALALTVALPVALGALARAQSPSSTAPAEPRPFPSFGAGRVWAPRGSLVGSTGTLVVSDACPSSIRYGRHSSSSSTASGSSASHWSRS
jgi:hypothetical protein